MTDRELLEGALGDKTRWFKVETLVAAVNCCSRPWSERTGEQEYEGFIRLVSDDGFEITKPGLGTTTYHVRVPWSAEPIITPL